jgi:hypothetical protein
MIATQWRMAASTRLIPIAVAEPLGFDSEPARFGKLINAIGLKDGAKTSYR